MKIRTSKAKKEKEERLKMRGKSLKEDGLDRKNHYGIDDLTPHNAIRLMKGKDIEI